MKDDAKSKETRERYLQHVQKMFELLGDSPEVAKQNAATVMRMETSLAKASLYASGPPRSLQAEAQDDGG